MPIPEPGLSTLATAARRAVSLDQLDLFVHGRVVDTTRLVKEFGFEPRDREGVVELMNCPFHTLAQNHTELVCGMNLRLVGALLDGTGRRAVLDPAPFAVWPGDMRRMLGDLRSIQFTFYYY